MAEGRWQPVAQGFPRRWSQHMTSSFTHQATRPSGHDGQPRSRFASPAGVEALRLEPLTDFRDAGARTAMADALRAVAGRLGATWMPVIGGESVATTATFDSLNPSHKRQV